MPQTDREPQPAFSHFFREHADGCTLVPKEVAYHTGRSVSTVYRWLRGETEPGVSDLVRLLGGLSDPIRGKLLDWMVQDLPIRWESVSPHLLEGLALGSAESAAVQANKKVLDVLNMLAELMREQNTRAEEGMTLSRERLRAIQSSIDMIVQEMLCVKLLQSARLSERKSATRAVA